MEYVRYTINGVIIKLKQKKGTIENTKVLVCLDENSELILDLWVLTNLHAEIGSAFIGIDTSEIGDIAASWNQSIDMYENQKKNQHAGES